jgi:hypothetical protein
MASQGIGLDWLGCKGGADKFELEKARPDTNPRKTMSYTVSTLLLRNLHDVFGEIDPVRRRTAIVVLATDTIWRVLTAPYGLSSPM